MLAADKCKISPTTVTVRGVYNWETMKAHPRDFDPNANRCPLLFLSSLIHVQFTCLAALGNKLCVVSSKGVGGGDHTHFVARSICSGWNWEVEDGTRVEGDWCRDALKLGHCDPLPSGGWEPQSIRMKANLCSTCVIANIALQLERIVIHCRRCFMEYNMEGKPHHCSLVVMINFQVMWIKHV